MAIDTGTTLIGVPSSVAQAIYAQIPNSQAMSASSGYAGYYQYPCSQTVNITLQFGGLSYSISDADFNLGAFSQQDTSMCTGAFFEMNLYVYVSRSRKQGGGGKRHRVGTNKARVY